MTTATSNTKTIEEILSLIPKASLNGYSVEEAAKKIRNGEIISSPITTLTERELAAGFCFLIYHVTPSQLKDIFLHSEDKEASDETILQIERQKEDGTVDFSSLTFLPTSSAKDMVQAYLHNTPSDNLNLSKEERALFHALDKKRATQRDVEQVLRNILQQRLDAYQQSGLEAIAPYERKNGKYYHPGQELREKTSQLEVAIKVAPQFVKYMMEYPQSKPTEYDIQDVFGWIQFNIDSNKPTFVLYHKSYCQVNEQCALTCFRHFYVSQGHNNVQSFGGGFPVVTPKSGSTSTTLIAYSSRTSTDLVAGFGGRAKKAMGSRIMGGKLLANLELYRKQLHTKYDQQEDEA